MSGDSTAATKVVERYIDAYNAKDFDAVLDCLAPDLDFQHYNRGFAFNRASELVDIIREFAANAIPDRQLGPALRTHTVGDVVYREQLWGGTLTSDIPGFGAAGESISLRLSTVFTVRDGKIVEYYDYG